MKVKKLNEMDNFEMNNNFPQHLIDLFESLHYEEDSGVYTGNAQNIRSNIKTIEFSINKDYLICTHNSKVLFKIIKNVDIGTLLVIMQHFGIFHRRYIYERIDAIVENFHENN